MIFGKLSSALSLTVRRKRQYGLHVEVREKEIRVRALEHHYRQIGVAAQLGGEVCKLQIKRHGDEVDGWIADGDGGHTPFNVHVEQAVIVGHLDLPSR